MQKNLFELFALAGMKKHHAEVLAPLLFPDLPGEISTTYFFVERNGCLIPVSRETD